MSTGDPLGYCPNCGQQYYLSVGHNCLSGTGFRPIPSWAPNTIYWRTIPTPLGWECPKCHRCYAPQLTECEHCGGKE